jgi:hypothetical protein
MSRAAAAIVTRRAAATRAIPAVNAIAPAPAALRSTCPSACPAAAPAPVAAAVTSSHRRPAATARRRAIRRRHASTPAASRARAVSAAAPGPATIHLLRGSLAHDGQAGNGAAASDGKSTVSGPPARLSGVAGARDARWRGRDGRAPAS